MPPGRGSEAYAQHTTPESQSSSGFVTITHPHHPFRGQRCAVIRVRRGTQPDVIVRLPDGSRAAVALSWTDYGNPILSEPTRDSLPLLDLNGLRDAARLIAQLRHDGRVPNRRKRSRSGSSSPSPAR